MAPVGALSESLRKQGAVRSAFLIGGAVGIVVLASACTADETGQKPAPRPTAKSTTPAKDPEKKGSVKVAPKLPGGAVLAQVANAQGNQQVAVEGPIEKGPLAIMVTCQGAGTITVTLDPAGVSFPLECGAESANTTYNQVELKEARKSSTVSVTAPSRVRWALTVGQ